jgi:peptide/nickel transport system substrate-binding protein
VGLLVILTGGWLLTNEHHETPPKPQNPDIEVSDPETTEEVGETSPPSPNSISDSENSNNQEVDEMSPPSPDSILDSADPDNLEKVGGILVLANRGDPPTGFDTMRTSSIALHHVAGALFGPGNLVMRCRENMYLVCPYLAHSWIPNQDFTEWKFILRTDVVWHDGTLFTPEDAKFWLDLAVFGFKSGDMVRAPAYFKGDLGEVEKVEVIPPDQLRITLESPNRFFPDILANPRLKIAHPRHLMEQRIEEGEVSISPLDVGLIGLGPFKFEDYEPGSRIILHRFNEYFEHDSSGNRLPYLDSITYIIMTDPLAMDVAFRTGRLDGGARGFGHYLSEERMDGYVRDLGDDVFFTQIEGGTIRIAFNVLKPGPWQDERVRRAIALWIDKESAIPAVLGGFGWTSPDISPNNPYKDKRFVIWPKFDLEPLEEKRVEAKRLMAEAGYADGFSMGHLCRARHTQGCLFLKDQLAGLGINLNLQIVDEGEWNRARISLEYDTQPGALSVLPIPEGTEGVYGRFSKSPDSYSKHEDPELDRYYRLLREATTTERRIDIWRQLQKYIFLEQTYIIPIAEATYVVAYRTYVNGLAIPPEDGHSNTDFATVWLNKER